MLKHKKNQSLINIIDDNTKINFNTDNKDIIDSNTKINLDTDEEPIINILSTVKDIINDSTTVKYYNISNSEYSWNNSSITFLENGCMQAFGDGSYKQTDSYTFNANFGNRIHTLVFNNDFTEFISTRKDDNETVKGKKL
jgi:hypothetical protein